MNVTKTCYHSSCRCFKYATITLILIISIIIADVVAVAATAIQTYEVELPILEVIEFRLSQIPCFV